MNDFDFKGWEKALSEIKYYKNNTFLNKINEWQKFHEECYGNCKDCEYNKDLIPGETDFYSLCQVLDILKTELED
ncbi:hypothetical protein [Clostridium sp.]